MSYVNLPPEATFAKLEGVIQRQRRLMWMNAAVMMTFATGILASLVALM